MKRLNRATFFWLMTGPALLLSSLTKNVQAGKTAQGALDDLSVTPTFGGTCFRGKTSAPSKIPRKIQATMRMDLTCSISPHKAISLLKQDGARLIDLRPSEDYAIRHAANSINIDLPEILTKPYLQKNLILLIGSGRLETKTIHDCMQLRKKGFKKVFVIHGGILGWTQHGYATKGNRPIAFSDFKLKPEELWLASQSTENIVLLETERSSMRFILPGAIVLKSNTIDTLPPTPSNKTNMREPEKLRAIILVTSQQVTENRFRELQKAASPHHLTFYDGSEIEYQTFIDKKNLALSARDRGPKIPECGS